MEGGAPVTKKAKELGGKGTTSDYGLATVSTNAHRTMTLSKRGEKLQTSITIKKKKTRVAGFDSWKGPLRSKKGIEKRSFSACKKRIAQSIGYRMVRVKDNTGKPRDALRRRLE